MSQSADNKKRKYSTENDTNDGHVSNDLTNYNNLNELNDENLFSSLGVISFENKDIEEEIYLKRKREIDISSSNINEDQNSNDDISFDIDDLINASVDYKEDLSDNELIKDDTNNEIMPDDDDNDVKEEAVDDNDDDQLNISNDETSNSDDNYCPSDESSESEDEKSKLINKKKFYKTNKNESKRYQKCRKNKNNFKEKINKINDDGDLTLFKNRIKKLQPGDYNETVNIFEDFAMPKKLYDVLKVHQREGVIWLLKLFKNNLGGILADEMGLGKTLIIIALLVTIYTKNSSRFGPILILAPATVMSQWVKEFHQWWPHFRVALFHSSGTYKNRNNKFGIIKEIALGKNILITSYNSLSAHVKNFIYFNWNYVILDEGHKIRSGDTLAHKNVKKVIYSYLFIILYNFFN